MMRKAAGFTLFLLMATISSAAGRQESGAPKGPTRSVKFATGETVIDSDEWADHVVVKDAQGELMSESWCEPGTFDSYLALFTKLKEALARGDQTSVVKLVAYPFQVNATKPLTFRNEASLTKSYNKIFTPQVLEKVRKAEPAAVFCQNGMGMLGDGVVWAVASAGKARVSVLNP